MPTRGGPRSEVRGQRSEVRSQRPEVSGDESLKQHKFAGREGGLAPAQSADGASAEQESSIAAWVERSSKSRKLMHLEQHSLACIIATLRRGQAHLPYLRIYAA
jgi:hypothetical protein